MLFSCSKEQPLAPLSQSEVVSPDMMMEGGNTGLQNGGSDDDDHITDPEKDEKEEKTNKKAKV